jgi:hypothetical protein
MGDETRAGSAAQQMVAAARAWVDSLSDEQRALAVYGPPGEPGDAEDERLTWFFTPTDHGGLTLHEMSARQQGLAMQLVASGLSFEGYVTASTIMGGENILDLVEEFAVDWGRERGRDPQLYYLRLFGVPGEGRWAWRYGGHHISLNNLVVGGEIASVTPNFFGSDPAEVSFVGGGSLRPLGPSEDLGRELFASLDGEQRAQAWLLDRAPADIVAGNATFIPDGMAMPPMDDVWRGRFTEPRLSGRIEGIHQREEGFSGYTAEDYRVLSLTIEPKGIPAARLTSPQRALLVRLLASFTGRAPASIAKQEAERYADAATLDAVHFAWAGGPARGERHYFRVQGPRVLIEYDNTQRGGNHCHAVWRDPIADFGLDVLYEHLDVFHRGSDVDPAWPVPAVDGRA